MEFIEAKTILTKVKGSESWYGIDYNMNLYKGCSHGCIYCDSRSNCYQIKNFNIVRGKLNAISTLERELSRKEKGLIGIGSMSDPYNPQEKKYEMTRDALKLIQKYNYGVSIDTKSDLVLRDIDCLKEISKKNNVIVKFTITTASDELSKKIEPHVCPSSKRFAAIKKLSDNGIFVGIMINPVLPFITDSAENIRALVRLAHENGAKFIHTYMSMTLRDNQREYYYSKISPEIKKRYIETYKESYLCYPLNAKMLYRIFMEECEKYGILYKMDDIIKTYKKEVLGNTQLSLF